MNEPDPNGVLLIVEGCVDRPLSLAFADLCDIESQYQIPDVSQVAPKRSGSAVRLEGVLSRAGIQPSADYLTLHSSTDDFHASIPLSSVRDRALLIYRQDNSPLPVEAGGPVRFFIPDHAACHTAEVDECANVKYVDRIEITHGRGLDNRPDEEAEHAELHRRQQAADEASRQ